MNKRILYLLFIVSAFFACKQKENSRDLAMNYESKVKESTSLLGKQVRVYTTEEHTDKRLSLDIQKTFKEAKQPLETEVAIFVNPERKFQEFLGIGGAITDAAAEVFSKLSEDKQEEFLNAYFSDEGINYNIIRTSIHSSDFGLCKSVESTSIYEN